MVGIATLQEKSVDLLEIAIESAADTRTGIQKGDVSIFDRATHTIVWSLRPNGYRTGRVRGKAQRVAEPDNGGAASVSQGLYPSQAG